ncbi:expressed unknown protein [Seminavis robusta]|uniref:Uncharacterized protein n=1 Tax=Seminavis robusta TaxID=568900 RepID=A0A9N8HK46_9STRA|nr:expressed unknown protein [Seminavis robusta]|eukprot:Sro810_g205730.1 n/a (251) ;mRNA; f:19198-19950
MFAINPATNILNNSIDSRSLGVHQYSEWREWAMGSARRHSQQDLMSEHVDAAQERHMYIPSRLALQKPPALSPYLGPEEMVSRVVSFFQSVHNSHVLRQLQIEEGEPFQSYQFNNYPPTAAAPAAAAATLPQHCENGFDDSFSSSTSNHEDNCCITELGQSTSFLREQEKLWNRVKEQQQQKQPVIPDWLHDVARQEGRRIRVVTVDSNTETRTVTCIGCQKRMLAAANVQIVFCPECGLTFCPEALAAE